MATIFSKIISGEIPCYKVAENNDFFAFLDISPLAKGHVLVVPKKEVDYVFDLSDSLLSEILVFSKNVANAIEKVIPCNRIGVAIIGLEVPHAHVHLIPLQDNDTIDFTAKKMNLDQKVMSEIALAISDVYLNMVSSA